MGRNLAPNTTNGVDSMNASRRVCLLLVSIFAVLFSASRATAQCVSLTTLGSASTQNFDTLSNTAGSTTNNLTITGWFMTETGGGARDNEQYGVDTGGSNTGDTYSYGLAGNTNRALGQLRSGTLIPNFGACFTNNTGSTIASLDFNYFGEQWRIGNTAAARDDRMDFQYSLNATSLITGTWTDHDALDFTNPIKTNATATALNGDLAANRDNRISTIGSLSIANGATFWIRWGDIDASGADDGLAVDDFSLTPQGSVVLPNLTISDVSQVETNAGTTTFTFAVNLSAPAGAGGVTFDIATADGTAEDDNPAVTEDNDYVAQSLTGQNIAMGSTGPYNFNVTVNGDVIPEANETFFVNVTSVTGANVTDGQGQGTIQNDDAACANLSINDVTQAETDAGTTTFAFTVSLSQAGCGTVTFDIATADGTAEDDTPATEDNDYVPQSLTGQTITFPATYTFNVTVNGDTTQEPDQTFFVDITNVTPGNVQVSDGQGLGTIVNDDFTRIHDVQGNGTASPLVGQTLTMRGIVTLLKSNGFFLQEELADYDADPNTSEGIFVFTSSPPSVAVGHDATVTGTVVEFNGLTEISPVTNVTTNSTGNTLPTAVTLTALDLPTSAGPDQPQLEKYEGMRLLAPSLVTVAPNDSFFDVETVLAPQPRPFREPGIPASDPIPPDPTSGLPDPNIPIWDENPERLNVDTNGRAGSTGETLTSNVTLTNVAGPLDFAFGRYRLINEANLTRTADMSAVPVPIPAANEFTIAGYNIENFNNNATQRQKAALTIRDVLLLPDIIGTVEIFDLADLQALATEIQTISGATYSAHLVEQDGTSEDNDQDVGFLVKTSRVSVTSVTAERAADTYINPNTSMPELLHDRPPLVLRGTVDPLGPNPLPIIVVVNHTRSFIDIELVAGEGVRVRAKRKAQAESLADLLNDLQTDNPGTPVMWVGDYNAFQFNNGYDDPISVLKGMPTPDDQIVVDQSPDLVNPDAYNLIEDVPADQRYSFIFEGTPQALDHFLVNPPAHALNTGIAVARVNSDYPSVSASVYASNAARPEGNSDHDPVVGYFVLLLQADLDITKTDSPDPVNAGTNLTYTITVTNSGPDVATTSSWSDTIPAGTTFVSLSSVAGWSCSDPGVGNNGLVSCSNPSFAVGSAVFTLVVHVDPTVASGTVLSNTATATSATNDPDSGDLTDTETTTVAASADLQISKSDTPDPVNAGSNISYQINITNNGPSNAATASFSDTLPAGTTFVSLSTTGSWSCTTPAVGATGTVSCTNPSFPATVDFFTLVVAVDPSVAAGTIISNTATVASATSDPNTGNESATATTTVATSADLSVTKSDTPDPVNAGANLTYTITVNNAGPSNASTVSLTDVLPAETLFFSMAAPAGWSCTTPGVFSSGTVTCTNPSAGLGNHVFTLVVNVLAATPSGTVISNTATVSATTSDPNTGNESGTSTTTVATSANMSVTKTDTPDPVTAGNNITYSITVTNAGPSNADAVTLSDTIPANTTFVSFTNPLGWTCSTPAVGATGTVSCTKDSSQVAGTATPFTLVVNVDPSTVVGTVISNTVTVGSTTPDSVTGNESATATTTVGGGGPADLSVTKTDSPDPVTAGTNLTYTITVNNAGPGIASTVSLSDTVPSNTSFVSLASPAGWSCVTPAVGAGGTITCTNPSVAVGSAVFTLTVSVSATAGGGTVISNTATVTSATADPNVGNESDTETTTVLSPATVTGTKTASGTFEQGSNVTYTIVLSNSGPAAQSNNPGDEFVDVLPPQLTLISANATSGTALATVGTNTVTWNGSIPAGGSVTITIVALVEPDAPVGSIITNQGTINYDADGNGTNETSGVTDDPSQPGSGNSTGFAVAAPSSHNIPALDPRSLMVLATLLAAIGVLIARRS